MHDHKMIHHSGDQQPSAAVINTISKKLEKVMDENETKKSEVEDGEISDEEEGEILSDEQVYFQRIFVMLCS